jgi:hypothetical protein
MADASILKKPSQSRVEDPRFPARSKEDLVDSADRIKCKLNKNFNKNVSGAEVATWSNL